MNTISIQTPSDAGENFRECQIIKAEINHKTNKAEIKVKGVSRHENVTTTITISDLGGFIDGKTVSSLHGYFKLKMNEKTRDLFTAGQ